MNSSSVIYLDYNATTPVDPRVVNAMLPLFQTNYGNPSSTDHILGWQAKDIIEKARLSIAENLGAYSAEIIFTAGATESINMVLRGLQIEKKSHIITAKSEHNAVLDTCQELGNRGQDVTYLDVDSDGLIDLELLEKSITEKTFLVTIMWVNNETGVIQPINDIARLCRKYNIIFMCDATQAIGKIPIDLKSCPVDIILGSAHKIYGPKGVGFLKITKELQKKLIPVLTGGGQEFRKRAGTLNVPSIVGFAKAIELAIKDLEEDHYRIKSLRDEFEDTLITSVEAKVNGGIKHRLYNTSNLRFPGYDSERIMQAIGTKVAASRGSACSTGKIAPSHVLSAMGLSEEEAHASIRFSFGRFTSATEINTATEIIKGALAAL